MPVTSPSANSLLWPLKFLWNYESPCSHSSVLAEDVAGFSQLDWFFLQCQLALWQASANWINSLGVSPGLPHRQTCTWPLTAFFPNAGQVKDTNEGVGVGLYLACGAQAESSSTPVTVLKHLRSSDNSLQDQIDQRLCNFSPHTFAMTNWKSKTKPDKRKIIRVHRRCRDNKTLSCTR